MVATKTITKPFAYDLANISYDYEFSPSTVGIIRSFGIAISPDGLTAITLNRETDSLIQWSFGTAWNLSTLSYVKTQGTNDNKPVALYVDESGQNIYTANSYTNKIYQHYLSTPWDISSYSSVAQSPEYIDIIGDIGDIWVKPDGTEIYVLDYTANTIVTQSTLSVPWNVNSISNTKNGNFGGGGICISADGLSLISQKFSGAVTEWA